jgi:hypothetical protein
VGRLLVPVEMTGFQLRAARGVVGNKLGYGGPMPRRDFAAWLGCSVRALEYYEAGERRRADGQVVPAPIPDHIAREALRLRDDPNLVLPARWDERRRRNLARREKWQHRKAERDKRLQALEAVEPPPF